jgi:transposase
MAEIARETKRYPSDLTDEEWERVRPLLPKAPRRGRRPAVDLREILNAIRCMARSGGGWRMLPTDFGPWQTVYWWFRRLVRLLLFRTIHDVALMVDRGRSGREASPSAAVIDSQTVKAPSARNRGDHANKKIVGRKRHAAVDTDGRLLMVNLTPADVADSTGGCRDRPPHRRRTRIQGAAAQMGRRANLRVADPLATPRSRLRATSRRLRGHDPRRNGQPSSPTNRPSLRILKQTLRAPRESVNRTTRQSRASLPNSR